MATDVERLVIRLEASATRFEKEMARARDVAAKSTREIENNFARASAKAQKSFNGIGKGISGELANLAKGAVAGFTVAEVGKMADSWVDLGNKVASSGAPLENVARIQSELVDIANRSATSIDSVGTLYSRLSRSAGELGATQGEVYRVTETVSKAFKMSGASAQEAESAVIQLSQALQSGRLQGDELRSILENAPDIAAAIAKEFGVSIGKLKEMGAAGELVAGRVFKAILNSSAGIDERFSKTASKISDKWVVLENNAKKYIGTSALVQTATAAIGAAMDALGNNIGMVANGAAALGVILAGKLLIAQGAVASLSAALALVGGPIGAAILGTVAAVTYLGSQARTTAESAKFYEAALLALSPAAKAADDAQRNLAAATGAADEALKKASSTTREAQAALGQIAADQEAAARAADSLLRNLDRLAGAAGLPDVSRQARQVIDDLRNGVISADEARGALERLAASNGRFSNLINALNGVVGRLNLVRVAAEQANAALANADSGRVSPADQASAVLTAENAKRSFISGQKKTASTPKTELEAQRKADSLSSDAEKSGIKLNKDEAMKLAREMATLEQAANKSGASGGGRSSGGGGGGGGTDYAREIQQIREKTLALKEEAGAIGLGAMAVERAKAVRELELAAKKAGIELTPAVKSSIEQEVQAYIAAKEAVDEKNKAMESAKQLQDFIGSNMSSFFSDIVSGGKNASEALMNLTKRLADAALKAAFLGEGPLAGLFGTAKGGGIFGSISGAFFGGGGGGLPFGGARAAGGPVSPGRSFLVGEKGPEMFVPKSAGKIVPNNLLKSGGGGYSPVYNIDARGADAGAVTRMEAALKEMDRTFSRRVLTTQRVSQARGVI